MAAEQRIDADLYEFYPIAPAADLPVGERLFIEVSGTSIVIMNVSGQYYAIADVCTHDDGPLGDGSLDGYEIICPRHGARFDIRSGEALTFPAVTETDTYPIRVVDDIIQIGIKK